MNLSILESMSIDSLKDIQSLIRKIISRKKKLENAEKRVAFINTLHYTQSNSFNDAFKVVKEHNTKNLLSLHSLNNKVSAKFKYFPYLIMQDWSHLYQRESDFGDYYVYCHVDPSDRVFVVPKLYGGNYKGLPFYVGKGVNNRAYDLKRNQGHGKKIKEVLDAGFSKDQIVHIAFKGLSENLAYEIESKLIYFFGTIYESNRKHASLVNLDTPKTPKFTGVMERIPFRREYDREGNEITK